MKKKPRKNIKKILLKFRFASNKLYFFMFGKTLEYEYESNLDYFKDTVFLKIAFLFILLGPLPMSYGAYMFVRDGFIGMGILELLIYVVFTLILVNKSISTVLKREIFIVLFFFLTILILFMTGPNGSGFVLLVATFVLAGSLLTNKQNILLFIANLAIFSFVSAFLHFGYLGSLPIVDFGSTWCIRLVTTQSVGLLLLIVVSIILGYLERQYKHIENTNKLIKQSEERFRLLFDKAPLGYQSLNAEGYFIDVNQKWLDLLGYERDEVIGQWFGDFLPDEYKDLFRERFPVFKKQGYIQTEFKVLHKDGIQIFIEFDGKVGHDADGAFKQTHCILKDITEQRKAEEALVYASTHDYLTDLFTHRYFEEIKETIDINNSSPVSIINMDINGVRLINDAFGHSEGDRMIIETAKIIQSCCGESEILARTGGDDFSILTFSDESEVLKLVDTIKGKFNEYNQSVSEVALKIYLSIGIGTKHYGEPIEKAQKDAERNLNRNKMLDGRSHHSAIISSIVATMHAGSHETSDHALRLSRLSQKVGKQINLSQNSLDELHLLSMLHDIGKIGIDDAILNKPGKLTSLEWEEMKKHPEIGYSIAMSTNELMPIAKYILSHHEWWDGSGYPEGLYGEDIPLLSRILAIVDAYDAMTHDRVYRAALTKEQAMAEIKKHAGTQFDPQLSDIFLGVEEDI